MALLECPDCGKETSENACECIHCGCPRHLLQPQEKVEDSPCYLSDSYQYFRRPLLQITVLGILFSIATTIILKYHYYDHSSPEWLFIIYGNFFLAFWATYFTSRKPILKQNDYLSPLQSLRRLLGETAAHWPTSNEDETIYKQQLVDSFRRKSNSSILMLSIMIAVSILILDRVTTILDGLQLSGIEHVAKFRLLLLALTGITAIISFVCFVVSVDALDVVFNKFKSVRTGQTIIRHYYQSTINPKYYGLLSMLVGVICLSAYYHYYIGCLAVGVTLFVGYFHWFPDFSDDVKIKYDKKKAKDGKKKAKDDETDTSDTKNNWNICKGRILFNLERLILFIIVLLPFILWLNDRIL